MTETDLDKLLFQHFCKEMAIIQNDIPYALPDYYNTLKKQLEDDLASVEEYKACKQFWYDKHQALSTGVNMLLASCELKIIEKQCLTYQKLKELINETTR